MRPRPSAILKNIEFDQAYDEFASTSGVKLDTLSKSTSKVQFDVSSRSSTIIKKITQFITSEENPNDTRDSRVDLVSALKRSSTSIDEGESKHILKTQKTTSVTFS